MRLSSLALLSTLVAVPSLAMADRPAARPPSPAEDAEAVAALAKSAITAGEPGALHLLMGPSVRYDLRGLSPCTGVGRKGAARAGKRVKLARCVVERVRGLDDTLTYGVMPQGRSKDRFEVYVDVDRHQLVLELRPIGGNVMVVAVTFRESKLWSEGDDVDEYGVQGGEIGGVVGGVVGGIAPPPPPPPPPPPAPPQIIPPQSLEQLRISGNRNLLPDTATAAAIVASGKTQLLVPVKLCVDRGGAVSSARVLKSSGFPDYDATLVAGVKTWRYQPILVNGAATPICSLVQFQYRVKSPPPSPPTPTP